MHENNRKEFELSGVIPYFNLGCTGKGWKFTTLETLGQKDNHAEYTISTYKQFRPDAEFVKCPISSSWASSKIEQVVDWCIENDIRTILISIDVGTRQQEADIYNLAFSKAKKHGIMIANAVGNKNENVEENDRIGTLSELESIGAVYWHEKLRQLKRAGYSNHSNTLDYADFTSIYLPEYDLHFSGTSCASPSFNAKRDILREYLETEYGISDYETVMKIIDENLLDLGEIGRDDYYGKGLFVLPEELNIEMKVSNEIPKINMIHPVKNYRITDTLRLRDIHPVTKKLNVWHRGIDYVGDLDIISATDGIVKLNGYIQGMGNRLVIQCGEYDIYYAHLAEKPSLKIGQPIKQGQVIAKMGTTGKSSGVHLHFEIRRGIYPNYEIFDPLKIIEWTQDEKQDEKVDDKVDEWKKDIVKKAFDLGLIKDLEQWTEKANEPMPTWAVLQVIMNSKEVK